MEWQLQGEKYIRRINLRSVNTGMYQKQASRNKWVQGHQWKEYNCAEIASDSQKVK